jgi:hypothetical protein
MDARELRIPRPPLEVFVWSRLAIWCAVLGATLWFEPHRSSLETAIGERTRDSGFVFDVWDRWDAAWLLRIAEHGYASAAPTQTAAFFPLYPGCVGVLGRVLFGHFAVAGVIVSLAATLGSFVLLQRLAERHIGPVAARRAVVYLAVFPMSLFLQAVYTESLFLFLALLSFLLAESRRFRLAGITAGLAMLTRAVGVGLLPAIAVLAWRSPRRGRALAQLALAPLVFALYPLALWWNVGRPFLFIHADLDPLWARHLSWAGPLGGVWDGLTAGWAAIRQLASGSNSHVYWTHVHDMTPLQAAAINLEQLVYLAVYLVLLVIVWRRFDPAYGVFATICLAIPLSIPSERWPLLSIPRFGLVDFPLFLALALAGAKSRTHNAVLGISALFLGLVAVRWATWQWVS